MPQLMENPRFSGFFRGGGRRAKVHSALKRRASLVVASVVGALSRVLLPNLILL